jgi:hypothetical protein
MLMHSQLANRKQLTLTGVSKQYEAAVAQAHVLELRETGEMKKGSADVVEVCMECREAAGKKIELTNNRLQSDSPKPRSRCSSRIKLQLQQQTGQRQQSCTGVDMHLTD